MYMYRKGQLKREKERGFSIHVFIFFFLSLIHLLESVRKGFEKLEDFVRMSRLLFLFPLRRHA